jgi:serine/threonine protein kinase
MRTGEDACEVYEYAPGINLRSYVASRGLTYGAILDIASSAARGLMHLHRHGLIHADLKPENFCVEERSTPSGKSRVCVWIIDFDTVTTPEDLIEQISVGSFSGTPGYMPPETFSLIVPEDPKEQERMAFAKDAYALGISLCQIISGELPELPSSQRTHSEPWPGRRVSRPSRLPSNLPRALRDLLASMSRDDWHERLSIAEIVSSIRTLRRQLEREDEERLIVEPRSRQLVPRFEEALAHGPALGPYLIINAEYALRRAADGEPGRIVELEDAHGRRLLGIAFTFASAQDGQAFYDERRRLLADLNRVRRAHPALFWGTFSDLVRTQEGPDGPFCVWFVRPLLPGAMSLREFLRSEPDLPLQERVAILRRIAESLAALEEAGYAHDEIDGRSIFFVPFLQVEPAATLPSRDRHFFDVEASRPYHQELMNMAGVKPIATARGDAETVQDVLHIADEIGVTSAVPPEALAGLAGAGSWIERASILLHLEQS